MLYPITGQDAAAHHPLSNPQELSRLLPELERESDGYRTVILSSETFHAANPYPLAQILAHHTVTVIAYVREHLSYLSSWYREAVKSESMSCSFQDFAYFNPQRHYFWLTSWQEAFPHDFRAFAYDRSLLPHGSVLEHFLSEIDFSGLSRPEIYENTSISGNLLFAKRFANLFLNPHEARKFIYELQTLSLTDPTFSAPMYIAPETADMIQRAAQTDRDILRSRFDIDFSDLTPPPHGSLAPDLARWDADRDLIIEKSGALGLNFGYTLRNLTRKNML